MPAPQPQNVSLCGNEIFTDYRAPEQIATGLEWVLTAMPLRRTRGDAQTEEKLAEDRTCAFLWLYGPSLRSVATAAPGD